MILNVLKINNRDFIDVRDLKAALLIMSSSTKADTPTMAVVVKFIDHINEVFNTNQPRSDIVTPTNVIEYNLFDKLNEVYHQNVKKEKKKKKGKNDNEELQGLVSLEPPMPVDDGFTDKQLTQIKKLVQEQNELIQKLLLELAKSVKSPVAAEAIEEIAADKKESKKKSTA